MSLKVALEKLGIPTHHMIEVFLRKQVPLWVAALDGKPDWDTIYATFSAAVDFPTCTWYEELMRVYPNAVVILTVRDSADAWYQSVAETIFASHINGFPLLQKIDRFLFPGQYEHHRFVHRLMEKQFGSTDVFKSPEALKQAYLDHIDNVKRVVPKDKLLIFNAKEGWKPLCAFLKVSAPEEAYPRVNETTEFRRRLIGMKMGAIHRVGSLLGGLALASFVAFKLAKRAN